MMRKEIYCIPTDYMMQVNYYQKAVYPLKLTFVLEGISVNVSLQRRTSGELIIKNSASNINRTNKFNLYEPNYELR